MHRTTTRFWECFESLPEAAQRAARRNFERLKQNRAHPSLHFKKVGKLWSARAGLDHRAVAVGDGPDLVRVWIGGHDEYERLIGSIG